MFAEEPAALTIPGLKELPSNNYIKGPEYRVQFDRILVPKFTKEVDMPDIREMFAYEAPQEYVQVSPFLTLPGQTPVDPRDCREIELVPQGLVIERGPFTLEFVAYEEIGAAIGNVYGLSRVDFQ